jgi:tRNA A58 N-methylase Trm61
MGKHYVCPWWIGYLLACPARRLLQDPAQIVGPYVEQGMTVLEPGPGMGFFTLELARRVGAHGRVIAIDIQPQMLSVLEKRAAKAGLRERIETRLVRPESMAVSDLADKVDFALVFAVVHEMPNPDIFFRALSTTLKEGATVLFVEPQGHVKPDQFDQELRAAHQVNLTVIDGPKVRRSHAVLLAKT